MRAALASFALAGCMGGAAPSLQLWTVSNPLCLLFCQAASEAVNAEEGGAAGGAIAESEGLSE